MSRMSRFLFRIRVWVGHRTMKHDVGTFPVGSIGRAKAQLEAGELVKALKTCRRGGCDIREVKSALDRCIGDLHSKKAFGVILSGYYLAGVVGQYSVPQLLRMMWDAKD